jgi:purine-nucleoside phosphorylase
MVIRDHINLTGSNPLTGPNIDGLGPRFPDLSQPYSNTLIALARHTAERLGLNLKQGVYAGCTGPSYETPAEVRMLRTLGADAVGMSTVPEVIVANHMGMGVLAISCITNAAAGMTNNQLSHSEVTEVAEGMKTDFAALIAAIVKKIDSEMKDPKRADG